MRVTACIDRAFVLEHAIAHGVLSHVFSSTLVSVEQAIPTPRAFATTLPFIFIDGGVWKGSVVHLHGTFVGEDLIL